MFIITKERGGFNVAMLAHAGRVDAWFPSRDVALRYIDKMWRSLP